jgi:hypothetical protein
MSQKINPADIPCEIIPEFKLHLDLDPVTLFDFIDQIGQGYVLLMNPLSYVLVHLAPFGKLMRKLSIL